MRLTCHNAPALLFELAPLPQAGDECSPPSAYSILNARVIHTITNEMVTGAPTAVSKPPTEPKFSGPGDLTSEADVTFRAVPHPGGGKAMTNPSTSVPSDPASGSYKTFHVSLSMPLSMEIFRISTVGLVDFITHNFSDWPQSVCTAAIGLRAQPLRHDAVNPPQALSVTENPTIKAGLAILALVSLVALVFVRWR